MNRDAAIALVGLPSTRRLADEESAYGGWVWSGPQDQVSRVVEYLLDAPELKEVFRFGAKLIDVNCQHLTPARARRIRDVVVQRLTNGWTAPIAGSDEPAIYVPTRWTRTKEPLTDEMCEAWHSTLPGTPQVLDAPYLQPLDDAPFAAQAIQTATELAENIWSPLDDVETGDTAEQSQIAAEGETASTGPKASVDNENNQGPQGPSTLAIVGGEHSEIHIGCSTRKAQALAILLKLGATSSMTCKSSPDVAEASDIPSLNPDRWKKVLNGLKRQGLVESADGRAGGYWLTPPGVQKARTLQSARPQAT